MQSVGGFCLGGVVCMWGELALGTSMRRRPETCSALFCFCSPILVNALIEFM